MEFIKLTKGQFAQVDTWNYDWLNQWKWFAHKCRESATYYAHRHKEGEHNKIILMHRLIMDTPDDMDVDHEDHNGLNCQEFNMRNCTKSQNHMNVTPHGKSQYLGVSYVRQYIRTRIKINGKQIHLGYSPTEELAARRYDAAAKYFYGEFANLNFK